MGAFVFTVFCIWIFFDPPGHMSWFYLPPTIAFMAATTPQMKTNAMVTPTFFILGFFIIIYAVVLPKLSGAVELGSVLFLCMFLVFYYLEGPLKLIGVIGAGTKLLLHNEQYYDFEYAANFLLLNLGAYIFIYIFSYIMDSPRPQRAVLKKIRRYYKAAQFLSSVTASDKQMEQKSIWMKFKIAFYRHELKTLPRKIHAWTVAINYKHFPKNTPDMIDNMLLSLHTLSNSFDEWLKSNDLTQTPLMFEETRKELEQWRRGIESVFQNYMHNLDSSFSHHMQEGLTLHIRNLEEIVNRHTEEIEQGKTSASEEEKENLFRLVGSYQGLSHALLSYASIAEKLDWAHWEEEVFA